MKDSSCSEIFELLKEVYKLSDKTVEKPLFRF